MPTTISGDDGVSQVQNNAITQADLTTAVLPIGVGQSWVNQTSIRVASTNYTNTTGRPIMVSVAAYGTTNAVIVATVGGVNLYGSDAGTGGRGSSITFIVPNGVVYSVSMSNITAFQSWAELR